MEEVKNKYITKYSKTKWKLDFLNDFFMSLDIQDLFDSTIEAQHPDDWDGMYTTRGEWKRDISIKIFKECLSLKKQ